MSFVSLEISNIECCNVRKWRAELDCDCRFRKNSWDFCYCYCCCCCYHCYCYYCCCCCYCCDCNWNRNENCDDDDVEFEYCPWRCLSLFRFKKKSVTISSCSKLSNWRIVWSFKTINLIFRIYFWFNSQSVSFRI